MSDVAQSRTISIGTMCRWKSGLEQLGAEGDMELLRLVAAQRLRQEDGIEACGRKAPEFGPQPQRVDRGRQERKHAEEARAAEKCERHEGPKEASRGHIGSTAPGVTRR